MIEFLDIAFPIGTLYGEAMRMALALSAFLLIFILAETWFYLAKPPVEWTRKFVHLSCGIIIACFHWIFDSVWSIVVLCAMFGIVMGVARHMKWFRSIYGVQRSSLGDIYYLIAVFALFLVSTSRPVIYFISVMTLTVSDALAAVLGSTYKKNVYTVESQSKSLEGSVVFFFSTFLIVHIPLLLMLKADPLHSILVALQVALVVTCLEAICLNGFDNIMIPLGTYFLTVKLLPIYPEEIAWQLGWQVVFIVILNYVSLRFHFISISGAIVGLLFVSGAFVFGGPDWLIIPLLALAILIFALCVLIYPQTVLPPGHKIYQVIAAFHATFIPTVLFFAHNFSEKYIQPPFWLKNQNFFYVLFVGAIAAHLAIAIFRFIWIYSKTIKLKYSTILLLSVASYVLLIPFGLWLQIGHILWSDLLVTAIIVLFSTSMFYVAFQNFKVFHEFPWEFRIQSISVFFGVLLALPVHLWLQK